MSGIEDNPLFIAPPPGMTIPAAATPAVDPEPDSFLAEEAAESFITLPPGVVDSATFRVAQPRVTTPVPAKSRDDIVFFPAQPGVPVAPSPSPSVDDDPSATQMHGGAEEQWRLVLPNGAGTCVVNDALFLGRNPAATIDRPDAQLMALNDTAKTLSKTHALLEVVHGALWVHDLDSTNGVFIVPASGDAVEVIPGDRVQVPSGANLELGEYVIRVERN